MRIVPLVGLLLLPLAGCGGGESTLDAGQADAPATFPCLFVSCNSAAGEFCWIQRYPNGEAHSPQCLAASCRDCDCAAAAVQADLDGANNCNGLVECRQEGAAITYTCNNPRL